MSFARILNYFFHNMGGATSTSNVNISIEEMKSIPMSVPVSFTSTEIRRNRTIQDSFTLDIDEMLQANNIPTRFYSILKILLSTNSFKSKRELVNIILDNKNNFSEACIREMASKNAHSTTEYITLLVDYFIPPNDPRYSISCARLANAYCNSQDFVNAKEYCLSCLKDMSPLAQCEGNLVWGKICESNGDFELAIKSYSSSYSIKQDPETIKKIVELVRNNKLEMTTCRKWIERETECSRLKLELEKVKAENEELKEKLYFSPMGQGAFKAQEHFVQMMSMTMSCKG